LPAGLSEPLHILEPEGGALWPWLLALAVLGALILWWRSRRRVQGADTAPVPPSSPRPTLVPASIRRIEAIQEEALATGAFRQGCHRLAELLRELLQGGELGTRVERSDVLTARELRTRLGDTSFARLLLRLAELRFGVNEPDRGDLSKACIQARAAVERRSIS
jgi:hypothetical protein